MEGGGGGENEKRNKIWLTKMNEKQVKNDRKGKSEDWKKEKNENWREKKEKRK